MDDGRNAVADVGEGPLLVLEERVTLHRIRAVETEPRSPENNNVSTLFTTNYKIWHLGFIMGDCD